jgi:hypothetical protein
MPARRAGEQHEPPTTTTTIQNTVCAIGDTLVLLMMMGLRRGGWRVVLPFLSTVGWMTLRGFRWKSG